MPVQFPGHFNSIDLEASIKFQCTVKQGVQFMRTMRTRDGGRKLIGGAEMVPLNPFH